MITKLKKALSFKVERLSKAIPLLTLLFSWSPIYCVSSSIIPVEFYWHPAHLAPLSDQEEMKEVFIQSFLATYRYSGAYQDQSDEAIQNYLAKDFEKILRPNLHAEKPQRFLAAKINEKLVGYAVFEKIDAETIYIAELALMPEIWRQGLGRKMTFAILDKEPTARRIVLVTERINILSQRFYTSLGFKPSSYRHDGYADEAYCSFEKTICPALLD